MTEQIMMLSLPNMGTDWLAKLIWKQNPELRYCREFFNPVTNQKYTDILAEAFGSEMVSNYYNIADPNVPCEEVYKETWEKENYNFAKENYSVFQVGFFAKKFRCFVLLRSTEITFPPSRYEVLAWYDAIYCSLFVNHCELDPTLLLPMEFAMRHADTLNKRVVAACEICTRQLLKEAVREKLPVYDYDKLMSLTGPDLAMYVSDMPGVLDPVKMADAIVSTKINKENKFDSFGVTDFLRNLRLLMQPYLL